MSTALRSLPSHAPRTAEGVLAEVNALVDGYPFTFFVYKQIAAGNAAIVTEAFLESRIGP
jgi:hypothetical protein